MTTGNPTVYLSAIQRLLEGLHDWVDDDHYVALLDDGYTPALSHSTWADVSTHEVGDADYSPQDVTGESLTVGSSAVKVDSDDFDFGSSVTITGRYAVILEGTAAAQSGTDDLFGYLLLDDTPADVSTTSAAFKIALGADGLLQAGNGDTVEVVETYTPPDWSSVGTPDATILPGNISPEPDVGVLPSNPSDMGDGITATAISAGEVHWRPEGDPPIPTIWNMGEGTSFTSAPRYNLTPLDFTANLTELTVAMVIRVEANVGDQGLFFAAVNGETTLSRAFLGIDSSEDLVIGGRRLDGDSYESDTSSGDVLPVNRWNVVIATFDWSNRTFTAYANGTQVAQETAIGSSGGATSNTDSGRFRLFSAASESSGLACSFRGCWVWKSLPTVADIDTELQKLTP